MKIALKLGLGTVVAFILVQVLARCVWSVYRTWLYVGGGQ